MHGALDIFHVYHSHFPSFCLYICIHSAATWANVHPTDLCSVKFDGCGWYRSSDSHNALSHLDGSQDTKVHLIHAKTLIIKLDNYDWTDLNGLFGWRGEGGGVEGSRVVLAKKKLILC